MLPIENRRRNLNQPRGMSAKLAANRTRTHARTHWRSQKFWLGGPNWKNCDVILV